MDLENLKRFAKGYAKNFVKRKLAKFLLSKLLAVISYIGLPVLALIFLAIFLFAIFFSLPADYQKDTGTLGFFSTGDDEWNIKKDKELFDQYLLLANNGLKSDFYDTYAKQYNAPSGDTPYGGGGGSAGDGLDYVTGKGFENGNVDKEYFQPGWDTMKNSLDFGYQTPVPYQPSMHAQASEFKLSYGDIGLMAGGVEGGMIPPELFMAEGAKYDVRHIKNVSPEQLNAKLGGALSGLGENFIAYGRQYGVDPVFLAGLAMHETGNGTNGLSKEKYNFGSITKVSGGYMSYSSKDEGVRELAAYIKRRYISKGITTIAGIWNIYAPLNADNDPKSLNKYWGPRTYQYMTSFGVPLSGDDTEDDEAPSTDVSVVQNGAYGTGAGSGSGWALLGALDRVLGDPIVGDKIHRNPDPKKTYWFIGPRFKWKNSKVTITTCDEEGTCTTSNYRSKLLTEIDQYDKRVELSYETETFHPSKGVTVTRERRSGSTVQDYEFTRLQGWIVQYGLPQEDDEFVFELAKRYDEITGQMVSGTGNFVVTNPTVTVDGKGFVLPLSPGYRISSFFGWRIHPILHTKKYHDGYDLAAPQGTPIYAAGDGVVTFAGKQGGYGNCIEINHGPFRTFYGHIANGTIIVQTGQTVKAGQVIAQVGSTGRSTGPHLHFEVRKQDEHGGGLTKIDPSTIFKF